MAGGLLQLVAYGAQDLYLTGNPQITFFKIVYRRHTNFAIESRKLTFNGTPNFNSSSVCSILKGPDLLHKLYLEIKINSGKVTCVENDYKAFRWLNWLGHILLKKISFNIGGTEIDKHNGEWYHLSNELSQKAGKAEAYAEMVGNTPYLTQIQTTNKVNDGNEYSFFTSDNETFDLYIPLQFWFCKNPGLALPIVALSHADMNIEIEFEDLENCIWGSHENNTNYRTAVGNSIFSTEPSFATTNIYADYIYLDVDERKRFAQSAHEYLIETIQIGSDTTSSNTDTINYKLNFTHPVKELVWVIYPKKYRDKAYAQPRGGMQYFNYTTQWDYTGFTGTPEPHSGTGMIGGRKQQNLWYGLPSVALPYIKNEMEPNFAEKGDDVDGGTTTTWSSGTTWRTTVATTGATINQQYLGYDRVRLYHVDTTQVPANGAKNNYTEKNLERFTGATSRIQDNRYETTTNDENITIPSPYLGSWGPTETNVRLLDQGRNPVSSAKLVLNGTDRISTRTGFYFNVIQPYQHHTNCPAPGINVYSFAFDPEDHQPSGTCNFSRLDNASIEVTLDAALNNGRTSVMKVYAVSYNILRIMSGLGQLAYAS